MSSHSRHQAIRTLAASAKARVGRQVMLLALAVLAGSGIFRCSAQTGTQHEYELKAGVLYHIIEYVEWPKGALSNNPPAIEIGLIGQIPFADAIEVLNGKTVQGRELIVKRISDPQAAARCQVLFVGASEKSRIPEIVAQINDRPILTVGEIEGFAEQGGMVNLIAGPNRIVMEINREVANKARLSMSSQLLKLAKVITR
ncbi:MAG TPA: YfiR family protein [Verrucomicrobiae bacterium]|nr:YfiR family protein [Verrucomicrobiae bacterium]